MYYGFTEGNDFQAKNVTESEEGTTFDVYVRSTYYDTFTIPTYGNHSVLNALSVVAIMQYEGFTSQQISHLRTFPGVKRRFTETEWKNGQILIDDYAHHPKEIEATIESARKKYPDKDIVAVFQPHTFTRTKKFLDEFANSLSHADHIYLCDIFASAREKSGTFTIQELQEKINDAELLAEGETTILKKHENSIILFMGAGDIQKYEEEFKQLA